MRREIYWEKALEKTKISIDKGHLFPLSTFDITKEFYDKNDFLIRRLDTSKFKRDVNIGPKINPFNPWEKILEIGKIGQFHHLILNKYPVQLGHILLITNKWMPQNGWLDLNDWKAIKAVNKDTSGLWFFNSSPLAGASQPHRHIQLLRRSHNENICPREKWFLNFKKGEVNKKLFKNIIVKSFDFSCDINIIYENYMDLSRNIGIGDPLIDNKPKKPYNLLITNNWIALIKRSNDKLYGFSVNGLGFAGYLLVTEKSDTTYLKINGPEKLLENFL